MTIPWKPVLKDVISEVLETMFFAMVDFEDGDAGDESFDYASQICLFNHTGRMEISLSTSHRFAKMITANFLGINEDQVGEDDIQDSLKELTNMVGGGYHVRTSNTEYELGIPRAWNIAAREQAKSGTQETGLHFGCFGEPAGTALLKFLPDGTCS
jgi:hypothetical protein